MPVSNDYIAVEDLGPVAQGTVRIVPLGGLGEIGMNCMAIETSQDLIVVDCGKLFSDMSHYGVDFVIPDMAYLHSRKSKLRAFVITHGHEDHIGGIPFALEQGLDAPVYASPFTTQLIKQRMLDRGLLDELENLKKYSIGDELEFGSMRVRTLLVTHSLVECAALVIETPIGWIVHTGDWRIDAEPHFKD